MTSIDRTAFAIEPLPKSRPRNRSEPSSAATGWILIGVLSGLIALLLLMRQGRIVDLLFPLLSTMLGAYLFATSPRLFLGYAWWLWFLTPEMRRFADFQSDWSPVNPLMLTPFLVSGLTLITTLQRCPTLRRRALVGFAAIFVALFYGAVIGVVTAGAVIAVYSLLTWLVPVTLGFHLASEWKDYPAYRAALITTFAWGGLAMGVYGLVQYFVAPGWDAFWLVNCGMINQGQPYPQQIRVFSTLNSSGPFAFVISAAILLTLISRERLKLPSMAFAMASLLLSLVRAAWIGWTLGFVYLLLSSRGRHRLEVAVLPLCAGVILTLTVLTGPLGTLISDRLDTLYDLQDDVSYQQRQEFYLDFLSQSVTNVRGAGIGSTSYVTKLNNFGVIASGFYGDSGVMQIPFVLGWFGSFFYVGGLAALFRHFFGGRADSKDLFFKACKAIVLMIAMEMIFENTLINVTGACFWTFLGMGLAAQRHYAWTLQQRSTEIAEAFPAAAPGET